jgi:hypothetical protein
VGAQQVRQQLEALERLPDLLIVMLPKDHCLFVLGWRLAAEVPLTVTESRARHRSKGCLGHQENEVLTTHVTGWQLHHLRGQVLLVFHCQTTRLPLHCVPRAHPCIALAPQQAAGQC